MEDFFSEYISYCGDTEVPAVYSRWAAIVGLGAYLGRQFYISHGMADIYPNIYCMLIGSAGTRKGTAIKNIKRLLTGVGYTTFAAERTSKEKFLMDLASSGTVSESAQADMLESFLSSTPTGDHGETNSGIDSEMFIAIDEFNDFIGNGNIEFISMLGNMWDYHGQYRNRIKTGKSVVINNPTISIIGGNTPTGFSLAFPSETIGQGFLSRILLIYAERNGKQISFPARPSTDSTSRISYSLERIKLSCNGPVSLTDHAIKLLDRIYKSGSGIDDFRFDSYANRRFTHLLKLTLLCCASRAASNVEVQDVRYANTMLSYAEHFMPNALGEFGKSKHSDVSQKIVQMVSSADRALTYKEIWKLVANDLDKMADLGTLLMNLVEAGKLQRVAGSGFLARTRLVGSSDPDMVDFSLLTLEEQKVIRYV